MKPLSLVLWPVAFLFGSVVRLRALLYRLGIKQQHHVGVPVISIGNITVGGTGKTPMAAFILQYLISQGHHPAYLSRGYGRNTKGYLEVDANENAGLLYGDEAILIANQFPGIPVAVCEDRVLGAKQLLAAYSIDVLVLDDAFQHLRIFRDLDILMIDGTRSPLKDMVLPAGRLREPVSSMRRGHVFVLGKMAQGAQSSALIQQLQSEFPGKLVSQFELRQTVLVPFDAHENARVPISEIQGQEVVAFSGLGNNAFFKQQLLAQGARLRHFHEFPDHHVYTEQEYLKILESAHRHPEINGKFGSVSILTTEKDYHRLLSCAWFRPSGAPVYFVGLEMVPVQGWEELRGRMDFLFEK